MDTALAGKAALVTGGTSGIGLSIAHALAKEGVNVAVVARPGDVRLGSELDEYGVRTLDIPADVSREEEIVGAVRQAIDAFGQLDLFVNNAGRALHQPFTHIDAETYRRVLDTNLSACLWGCREAARHFIQRRTGSILVVGSTCVYTPGPTETVYRISKVGLVAMVESMAVELAPYNIRVNLLVPGYHRTRLTQGIPADVEAKLLSEIPLRRAANFADCGNAAVFLLSDALSGYTTGAELRVDGGIALRPLYLSSDEQLRAMNEAS